MGVLRGPLPEESLAKNAVPQCSSESDIARLFPARYRIRAKRYSAPTSSTRTSPLCFQRSGQVRSGFQLPDGGKPRSREQELERNVRCCGAFCGARCAFSAESAPSPGCSPNAGTRTLPRQTPPWDCDFKLNKFGAGPGVGQCGRVNDRRSWTFNCT